MGYPWLLDGKGPENGTLEDALEILLIYEAYRKPDSAVHYIGKWLGPCGCEIELPA